MLALHCLGAGADNLQNLCGRRGEAFGGLDLVFCGDFSQLEPVGNSTAPSLSTKHTCIYDTNNLVNQHNLFHHIFMG
jgi:hypothetical protein